MKYGIRLLLLTILIVSCTNTTRHTPQSNVIDTTTIEIRESDFLVQSDSVSEDTIGIS